MLFTKESGQKQRLHTSSTYMVEHDFFGKTRFFRYDKKVLVSHGDYIRLANLDVQNCKKRTLVLQDLISSFCRIYLSTLPHAHPCTVAIATYFYSQPSCGDKRKVADK